MTTSHMNRRRAHLPVGAAAAGAGAGLGADPRRRRRTASTFRCFAYRTGPFAGSGIPIANGMRDYLAMLNERDGGIGGVKIVYRGMRDRLRHQEGDRVLRAGQGQEPGGDQPLVHRHHAGS